MQYINDRTGEKITELFERGYIDENKYFEIMEYLSMNIYEDLCTLTSKFIKILDVTYVSNEMKKILFIDYVHKFADLICVYCMLNEKSTVVINNKKFLHVLIGKIDEFEQEGCNINKKKIEIIEKQYEIV